MLRKLTGEQVESQVIGVLKQ